MPMYPVQPVLVMPCALHNISVLFQVRNNNNNFNNNHQQPPTTTNNHHNNNKKKHTMLFVGVRDANLFLCRAGVDFHRETLA